MPDLAGPAAKAPPLVDSRGRRHGLLVFLDLERARRPLGLFPLSVHLVAAAVLPVNLVEPAVGPGVRGAVAALLHWALGSTDRTAAAYRSAADRYRPVAPGAPVCAL